MKCGISTALLLTGSVFIQTHIGFADAPENILAKATGFTPTITCSDKYSEKVLTERSERIPGEPPEPPFREVIQKPQRIAAKIVANLEGFDFVAEINDELPLGVSVGNFAFEATLADSLEAGRNGGTFPANGKKATFLLIGFVDKANGDAVEKLFGRVIFSWTPTRLTVKITCSDIAAAGISEIAASDYIGLYSDDSELGNKPSGSVRFSDEPKAAAVTFGPAAGEQGILLEGMSKTTRKKYGSEAAETLEELFLQSVNLSGKADPNSL